MSNKNETTFEELIDMMIESPNHNPRDYCFRFALNTYPKHVHESFGFPGVYVKDLKTDVFTDDGDNLQMDAAHMVMPDGDIVRKSTINVEHQSYPIEDKIDSIYDYKLYLIHKYNLPSHSIVMTNIDYEEDEIICESYGHKFNLRLNVVREDDISKRLNDLSDKIESKEKISFTEAMDFVYISIFVTFDYAKGVIEPLANLFSRVHQMESNLEMFLHRVLKKMIKFHFDDDKSKLREMLIVISESLFQRNPEGLTYQERTEWEIDELIQKQEKLKEVYKIQMAKQEEESRRMIAKQEEENRKVMAEKDEENRKLKLEIERLKRQISG